MERENIYKGSTFNMKCQYCGAVLNLTDEVCPHCGRKPPAHRPEGRRAADWQEE